MRPTSAPKPHTRALFVRHAEVENPDGVLYGRLPGFSLSAVGREQAEATAAHLAGWRIDAIYSSPLERAWETAEIIAQRFPGVPLRVDERLNEIRWVRQGCTNVEFDRIRPRVYDADFMLPGDESLEEIAERVQAFCAEMAGRHPGGTVVAVTHGDVIAVARAIAAHRPLRVDDFERDYPARGSITPVLVARDGRLLSADGTLWGAAETARQP